VRLPRIREADGSCRAGLCSCCREEIYVGEGYYRIQGEAVCRYCLPEFARRYFAPCLCAAGEEG